MKQVEQNAHVMLRHEQNARASIQSVRLYYFLPFLLFFLSCAEKKRAVESIDTVGRDIPVRAPKALCIDGKPPSVLSDRSPISEIEEDNSPVVIYALGNDDSLTVKLGTCENPSYEYTYSTTRYYRGIDEIRFYYGAVNSFYLMLDKEHQPGIYLHRDLIEASKVYLAQHKKVGLQYPIPFTSEGKAWTYTLEKLEMNGERRTMKWTVDLDKVEF
jgi:hypothetical protein